MPYSAVEQEAIILNAAWEMIDDMVNHAIFVPLGDRTSCTNLMPQSKDTLRLFNVLLADFLSPLVQKRRAGLPFSLPEPPQNARSSDLSFLFYLRRTAENLSIAPQLDALVAIIEEFSTWLEADSFVPDVWFPSIGLKIDLTIERRTWIKICGDIAKHSFVRLEPNVTKIVSILGRHGQHIDRGQAYLILLDFWDWFHTHLFAYHASTIAEFLNNIRWEFYAYLRPEFERAFRREEHSVEYSYDIPEAIKDELAHAMYWNVMNRCRAKPWFPRFSVTESLKKEF